MTTRTKPSFIRLFLSGFAIGAVALVSVQAAQADGRGIVPMASATTR